MGKRNMLVVGGTTLIILGALLMSYGLQGLNAPIACPANGCPPTVIWQIYGWYYMAFWSGNALFIAGALLLALATTIKPTRPEPESGIRRIEPALLILRRFCLLRPGDLRMEEGGIRSLECQMTKT